MPINVSDFVSNFKGGGARPNLFEVICPVPSKITGVNGKGLQQALTYLCKAASLPVSEVTKIAVPYRGRNIYVAGVRQFEETWNTTVLNDVDFVTRRGLENWMNQIHTHETNIGFTNLNDYSSNIAVRQLHHRDGRAIREYQFRQAWPSQIGAIDLAADSNDAVEEFEVQWAYSWWTVNGELDERTTDPSLGEASRGLTEPTI